MELITVYLLLVVCSVFFYVCFRFGQWVAKRWLVGWKVIVIKPNGDNRVWYFERKE